MSNNFNGLTTDILIKIVNGEINPLILAHENLALRGVDLIGNFVGFQEAEKLHTTEILLNYSLN